MNEDRLRELHREAHAGERAPAFRRLWAAARSRRRPPRPLLPLLATLALAGAALVLMVRFLRRPEAVPSLPAFHAPTDFLLETPGLGLLRDVPSLSKGVIE